MQANAHNAAAEEQRVMIESDDETTSPKDNTSLRRLTTAQRKIYSNPNTLRPPAATCLFCDRILAEVGGQRLTAQSLSGVTLFTPGGPSDLSGKRGSRVVHLFEGMNRFVVVRDDAERATEAVAEKARREYATGHRPWFCQECGRRTCHECGAPIVRPAGSQVLSSDGGTSHVAILPADLGCLNKACSQYKLRSR